jgi:hypothetical protein
MLSIAVSKPLPVPLCFKPNDAHLTFALKLLFVPFSRKLRIGPTTRSIYVSSEQYVLLLQSGHVL